MRFGAHPAPDLIANLESLGGLDPARPTVRVLVNEEDRSRRGW